MNAGGAYRKVVGVVPKYAEEDRVGKSPRSIRCLRTESVFEELSQPAILQAD